MNVDIPTTDYDSYVAAWEGVSRRGWADLNIDAWASGRRYVSLVTICVTPAELAQLRELTVRFTHLIDRAVHCILNDPEWWTDLAWPWPAIEFARQEPPHPSGHASLFGRFDCLMDVHGVWHVIEYNADTPSGAREASGLEPGIAELHPGCRPVTRRIAARLIEAIKQRLAHNTRRHDVVGVVSSHSWIEDMAQATWLAGLLRETGVAAVVGDITDLTERHGRIVLRGTPITALYRFFPVERLYRYPIFASLCEASIDGQLIVLNGLRGFLAQSKVCLAWLWANRSELDEASRAAIERHLPRTTLARDPSAAGLRERSVVKHVNGREGDSVVFGATLGAAAWEARLLEGGYVVQEAIHSRPCSDVEVDDPRRQIRLISPRYACVGAFSIGGQFAGCYARLDGPITSSRATYAATLLRSTAPG